MKRGETETETCRLNGWSVGTVLVGDEGFGPEAIVITAIGEKSILAKKVRDNTGCAVENPEESLWTLKYRDWVRV